MHQLSETLQLHSLHVLHMPCIIVARTLCARTIATDLMAPCHDAFLGRVSLHNGLWLLRTPEGG